MQLATTSIRFQNNADISTDDAISWSSEADAFAFANFWSVADGVDVIPHDSGAAAAIEQMRTREAVEQLALQTLPFYVEGQGVLTGVELAEDILSGVLDQGDELTELRQFQTAVAGMSNLDDQARRVMEIVEQWTTRLSQDGRTSMTPEEKAQFAQQLRQAGSTPA